ncbi:MULTISPECIES: DUF2768 domain-containing protein [Bacillaceae]|uniref:NAD(FAD)-dependent dehydrogenase n=1 Tax=Domibacillus aminovorans TaxID=29332 RepID=A0A177KYG3_9BACI|nr:MULTISPECIES: DUF2768 domain-containing protein [Bacillaceae]OAH55904.1 hypothetical protein AWH48_04305 [Domibacillus aminovorans]OAH58217.1 hypothetical protein AWH49_05885 [Domibacillus aminovorans]
MSASMLKMWISFAGMGLMIVAIFSIYVSRYKINNRAIKGVTALFAYLCMVIGGLIVAYVVLSGPTGL